jgi:hypothetical protein
MSYVPTWVCDVGFTLGIIIGYIVGRYSGKGGSRG